MNISASVKRPALVLAASLATAMLAAGPAAAEGYTITIKGHRFDPENLEVPAGQRFQITVVNQDPTPEEFESNEFHVEKLVNGNSKIIVFVGPLKPGTYGYFGDFNPDTAQGTLTAK